MNKEIILNIQKQLFKLTNKKFSKIYVKNKILPIIEYIALSDKKKFLVGGSQGIGKTTLIKVIKLNIERFYKKKVLSLCLDDYYLKKNQRLHLSKTINPILVTRGVPGTHDINILIKDIERFDNSKYPIKIPIFDKLIDNRINKTIDKIKINRAELLLIERLKKEYDHKLIEIVNEIYMKILKSLKIT